MDKEEAKLLLADKTFADLESSPLKDDPKIQEAIRLVESDTDLVEWWSTTVETDQVIREKLVALEPPADLRASIRASLEREERSRLTRRRIVQWFSIAASLALVGMIGSRFIIDRSDDFEGPLDQIALEYSMYGPRLTYFNKDGMKLVDWLTENDIELPSALPAILLKQEGIGCRPLNWSENRVAILCFNAETVYHLFIGKSQDFNDFKSDPNIGYDRPNKNWTVSAWRSGEHVFVLTAKATIPAMEQMLADYTP